MSGNGLAAHKPTIGLAMKLDTRKAKRQRIDLEKTRFSHVKKVDNAKLKAFS